MSLRAVLFSSANRAWLAFAVGVAAIFASAGMAVAQSTAPGYTLPAVTGTAPVGRIEMTLTDAMRPDPFTTDRRQRELAIWIWYPAVAGSTGLAAPYLPSTWADLLNSAGVVSRDLNTVRTNS